MICNVTNFALITHSWTDFYKVENNILHISQDVRKPAALVFRRLQILSRTRLAFVCTHGQGYETQAARIRVLLHV